MRGPPEGNDELGSAAGWVVSGSRSFAEALSNHYGAHRVDVRSDRHVAQLDVASFGPFQAGIARGREIGWERQKRQLDEEWHDCIFLLQQRGGVSRVRHNDRVAELRSHDLVMLSAVGECSFEFVKPGALISLALPFTLLERSHADFAELLGATINGSQGVGCVLSSVLGALAQPEANFDADDCIVLGEIIGSMLDHCRTGSGPKSNEVRHRQLARLQGWVEQHLDDPDLGPDKLARVCNLSRSQLYRLFRDEGTTPQAWVWNLRLQAARACLINDRGRTITDIAFSVGFNSAAHFSRAFRQMFDCSPREVSALTGRTCA